MSRHSTICHPKHYTNGAIEAIQVIEDWAKYCWSDRPEVIPHLANIIKYACRASLKGDFEQNMRKIAFYALRAIHEEERLK